MRLLYHVHMHALYTQRSKKTEDGETDGRIEEEELEATSLYREPGCQQSSEECPARLACPGFQDRLFTTSGKSYPRSPRNH